MAANPVFLMLSCSLMRKKMFAQLPESLQKEVLYYLQVDFQKAKKIHDEWIEKQISSTCPLPMESEAVS